MKATVKRKERSAIKSADLNRNKKRRGGHEKDPFETDRFLDGKRKKRKDAKSGGRQSWQHR